ncbi:MAG: transcription elongation factor GreA [Defluviitaleaceae bacterium]|nr:transcription elongation factor GreA [Defluviitaleaceae bacterium]
MSDNKVILTYEGLKKYEEELQELKVVRRRDVAEKIKEARGQGDLSENAEYDSAKEEQAEVEARIAVLEKMLRNAEIIDEDYLDSSTIRIGNKVEILDKEFNEKVIYTIVGSAEADPLKGRISNESPLGKVLIGCSAGDTVKVDAPAGAIEYEILSID